MQKFLFTYTYMLLKSWPLAPQMQELWHIQESSAPNQYIVHVFVSFECICMTFAPFFHQNDNMTTFLNDFSIFDKKNHIFFARFGVAIFPQKCRQIPQKCAIFRFVVSFSMPLFFGIFFGKFFFLDWLNLVSPFSRKSVAKFRKSAPFSVSWCLFPCPFFLAFFWGFFLGKFNLVSPFSRKSVAKFRKSAPFSVSWRLFPFRGAFFHGDFFWLAVSWRLFFKNSIWCRHFPAKVSPNSAKVRHFPCRGAFFHGNFFFAVSWRLFFRFVASFSVWRRLFPFRGVFFHFKVSALVALAISWASARL